MDKLYMILLCLMIVPILICIKYSRRIKSDVASSIVKCLIFAIVTILSNGLSAFSGNETFSYIMEALYRFSFEWFIKEVIPIPLKNCLYSIFGSNKLTSLSLASENKTHYNCKKNPRLLKRQDGWGCGKRMTCCTRFVSVSATESPFGHREENGFYWAFRGSGVPVSSLLVTNGLFECGSTTHQPLDVQQTQPCHIINKYPKGPVFCFKEFFTVTDIFRR